MKPLKEKINITVDADVINEIRALAEKDDRNLSQYINLILKKWIANDTNKQSEDERL